MYEAERRGKLAGWMRDGSGRLGGGGGSPEVPRSCYPRKWSVVREVMHQLWASGRQSSERQTLSRKG